MVSITCDIDNKPMDNGISVVITPMNDSKPALVMHLCEKHAKQYIKHGERLVQKMIEKEQEGN